MSNIINYELISLANTDESLINLIKGLVISRFLQKKTISCFMAYSSFIFCFIS